MRKKSLIILLSIILILSPMASADFFDFLTGMFSINQEEKPPTEGGYPTTVYEQVTCVFIGSTSQQKCYAPNIDQSCVGTDSCTMTIYGTQGSQVYIKACNGEGYATIDSSDESIEFKCDQPVEKISEQIECTFKNSNTAQKCYSVPGQYSCEGVGSCAIQVSGDKDTRIIWRSTCSVIELGSVIDGINNGLIFTCETTEAVEEVKEEVKCVFKGATQQQECFTISGVFFSCKGLESCSAQVSGGRGLQSKWTSSCGGYASTVLDGNNEVVEFSCEQQPTTTTPVFEPIKETVVCIFKNYKGEQTCMTDDKKFSCSAREGKCAVGVYSEAGVYGSRLAWYSTCGGKAVTILDRVDETITFDCGQITEVPAIIVTPAEMVKEQVKCRFLESKQLQKCYSEFGQTCEGETECMIDIVGEKGRKTALKSSCGGYAYIIIDGSNEEAVFKCVPREEVAPEQIVGRGFKRAAWECYDKAKFVSQEVGCLPSEIWHRKAEEFCKGHCYQDGSKCGVNSFSVSEECYTEELPVPQEATEVAPQEQIDLEKLKEEMEGSKEETLFCKDSCPLDGKCYPFGYRKKGMFCSDEGMFKEQLKEEETCDNNFECKTNVCVNGKCISAGLIKRVISWLTSIFG